MKIRQGFVSNSSSSSFLVFHKDAFGKDEPKLSDEQAEKLENFGFYMVNAHYIDQVPPEVAITEDSYNYGYHVHCNEDEVFEFLLKNKIPFVADRNYGRETIFYNEGDDFVIVVQNYGKQMEMEANEKDIAQTKPIEKIPIKTYIL